MYKPIFKDNLKEKIKEYERIIDLLKEKISTLEKDFEKIKTNMKN